MTLTNLAIAPDAAIRSTPLVFQPGLFGGIVLDGTARKFPHALVHQLERTWGIRRGQDASPV